jgi:VWFA-related protein
MRLKGHGFWAGALWMALVGGIAAQAPAPAQNPPAPNPQTGNPQDRPTFRVQVDLVSQDVIVRNKDGLFVPDLTKDEFKIYEDGVLQDIASMTVVHGGRVSTPLLAAPARPPEGIILPPARRTNDVSGRIFLFFVDDLHVEFHNTVRVRELFRKIANELVHDGDMFGIVSSGPSSILVDMTYDKARLNEAINKITGDGLKPSEIIEANFGGSLSELRYRAQVAFMTVMDTLANLEKVHDRRKAVVYVSDGYDFNPFAEARLGLMDPSSPFLQNVGQRDLNMIRAGLGLDNDSTDSVAAAQDPLVQEMLRREEFSDSDLAMEMAELTRAANRANATIYTIDPRGLVGQPDLDQQVDPTQWRQYVQKSQDTLRVIADDTGGFAIVNSNDFDKGLKRIDADSSDYYVLGFYSKNPDPTKRRRKIEIEVTRPGVSAYSRQEYVLAPRTSAPR